ncbi:hypothetical protein [Mesorhizobium sp. CO1-1-8]|uniref:hypothetical protein n=1 Tax=Mesorhizobium sp. CO1-1-8 TaxID=2876631 RepID=UPI001CD156AD|nr:hypothetical protein [Mesorhizobium sp. CO1-1-8]MBZ9773966.1 hypothetical protein [Mesorhizobium sp. CO1-1-8]
MTRTANRHTRSEQRARPADASPRPSEQRDQLFFDQIIEAAVLDAALKQTAVVNPGDKFELVFRNLLEALFVERMDQNEEIFARFMNHKSFQKVVTSWLSSEAYRKFRVRTDDAIEDLVPTVSQL